MLSTARAARNAEALLNLDRYLDADRTIFCAIQVTYRMGVSTDYTDTWIRGTRVETRDGYDYLSGSIEGSPSRHSRLLLEAITVVEAA